MAPVLAPWQAGWDLACCLYLGGLVGALRAVAPGRGGGGDFSETAITPGVMSPFSLVPETCVPDTVST